MIVVDSHGVNRDALRLRFAEGGYEFHEAPHFLLFLHSETPRTILVHWFLPGELNTDLKHYVVYELKPLGLIQESRDFGTTLAGIVGSFCTNYARDAWNA